MFTVVYDANVLYPAPLRDLLIRLARTRLFHARWTNAILDEAFHALTEQRSDLDPAALGRTRQLMCDAVPDCVVEGWQPLVADLELPDPDDRHVLAAAIRAGAQTIVTTNLKDFPLDKLEPFAIEAQHPDLFVLGLIDLGPGAVTTVVREQQSDLTRHPKTLAQMLDTLERLGLVQSVAELRSRLLDP